MRVANARGRPACSWACPGGCGRGARPCGVRCGQRIPGKPTVQPPQIGYNSDSDTAKCPDSLHGKARVLMDFEKYQNLHTIIMLRDVIRKWWRVGAVLRRQGRARSSTGRRARSSRPRTTSAGSRSSRRKASAAARSRCGCCTRSSELARSFGARSSTSATWASRSSARRSTSNGEYEGMHLRRGLRPPAPISEREAELLKTKIAELNPGATDLDRALERIPVMAEAEVREADRPARVRRQRDRQLRVRALASATRRSRPLLRAAPSATSSRTSSASPSRCSRSSGCSRRSATPSRRC